MRFLLKTLKEPHPAHDQPLIYLRTITIISLCIFLIIWLMEPFDAKVRYGQSVTRIAAIYSVGGFLCMLVNYIWILIFPKFFAQKKWTLGKEILILIYELSTVALVVATLSAFLVKPPFSPISYPKAWLIVFIEGILPYLVAILIKHIYLLKKNLKISQDINQLLPVLDIKTSDQNSMIEGIPSKISIHNFLFAESKGNYLLLTSLEGSHLVENLTRMTIKEFCQKNAHFPNIFKCHRAFVVNLSRIAYIEGNAAGYQILIPPSKTVLYVSRQHIEKFRENIEKFKDYTS